MERIASERHAVDRTARSRHTLSRPPVGRHETNLRSSTTPWKQGRGSTRSRNVPTKSTSLNRAQRRAQRFGHKENPPEDYKALKFSSRKSTTVTPSAKENYSPGKSSNSSNQPTARFIHKKEFKSSDSVPSQRPVTSELSKDKSQGGLDRRSLHKSEENSRRKSSAPLALPYTTPASEFLYGHSVVISALRSSRRKLYKLYLYNGETAEVRGQDQQVRKLALAAGVEVTRVGHDWLGVMDKMSGGRPHNVCQSFCRFKSSLVSLNFFLRDTF